MQEFLSGLQVGQLQILVTAAYNKGGIEMAKAMKALLKNVILKSLIHKGPHRYLDVYVWSVFLWKHQKKMSAAEESPV